MRTPSCTKSHGDGKVTGDSEALFAENVIELYQSSAKPFQEGYFVLSAVILIVNPIKKNEIPENPSR